MKFRVADLASLITGTLHLFTQPPMRRMRICFTDVFFVFLFFSHFFPSATKYQTIVLGKG